MIKGRYAKLFRLLHHELAINIFRTYTAKFVYILFSVLNTILSTRALGTEGRGIFAILLSYSLLGITFCDFGIPVSNTYFLNKKKGIYGVLISNSIFLVLVLSLIIGVLSFSTGILFKTTSIKKIYFIIPFLCIPVGIANTIFQNIFIAVNKVTIYNLSEVSLGAIQCSLTFILFILNISEPSAYITTYFLSIFFTFTYLAWKLVKFKPFSFKISFLQIKESILMSFKSYALNIFGYGISRVGIFIMQYNFSKTETGYYSLASSLIDMFFLFASITSMLSFPSLVREENLRLRLKKLQKLFLSMAVLYVIIGVLIVCTSSFFLPLMFGEDFAKAVPLLNIMIPGVIFYSLNSLLSYFITSLGFPKGSLVIWCIVFFEYILLNFNLLPIFKAYTVSVVYVISALSLLILNFLYIKIFCINPIKSKPH